MFSVLLPNYFEHKFIIESTIMFLLFLRLGKHFGKVTIPADAGML
jgi:hypothetical protein